MSVDFSRSDFLVWFHSQPNIDPARTNHRLLDALWHSRDRLSGPVIHECGRADGVTTTLLRWLQWSLEEGSWDASPVTIVTAPVTAEAYASLVPWASITCCDWSAGKPSIPRSHFVLLDVPICERGLRSPKALMTLEGWLRELPNRYFFADQRKAQLA